MDEAAIVARVRRDHSVGTHAFFEDPDFPATDKSLYHVGVSLTSVTLKHMLPLTAPLLCHFAGRVSVARLREG